MEIKVRFYGKGDNVTCGECKEHIDSYYRVDLLKEKKYLIFCVDCSKDISNILERKIKKYEIQEKASRD